MWHVMVASVSAVEDAVAVTEEEGQISVVFWSVTFVLLLIVTVWFYITQIAPIRRFAGEVDKNDKEDEVAQRILEHLGDDLHFNGDICGEDSIKCTASTSTEAVDLESRYEYVDDEIHIHYSKCAWEDENFEASDASGNGAPRRRSMENMDLIFPGFLPSIVEEDENDEDTVSESSEESQDVEDIDQDSNNSSNIPTALVFKRTVNNNGGATMDSVNKEYKWSETITGNTKRVEGKGAMTSEPKHDSGVIQESSVHSRYTSASSDERAQDANGIKSGIEAVKTNAKDTALIYSPTDNHAQISETENNEIIPFISTSLETCVLATEPEVVEDFTSGSFDICPDKEKDIARLKSAFEMNGDVIESDSVFTLSRCDLSQTSKQDANEETKLCTAIEKQISCSSENGPRIARDLLDRHAKKAKFDEPCNQQSDVPVPKEDIDGLGGNHMDIKMEDSECKSNGFLEHIDDPNEHTTHAWTFFSMSGADEATTPQNGISGQHRLEQVEVPKIIIDIYDDDSRNDVGLNHMDEFAVSNGNGGATYLDSFETDIDVEDIDDEDLEDLEGEYSVFFKRTVSVTDLDKILLEEGAKDGITESNGGGVLETDLSVEEPHADELVNNIAENTTEISKEEETRNFNFANETTRIDNDPSMNIQHSVIVTTTLSDCVDKQESNGELQESTSSFDALPKNYSVETILNEVSFHRDGVYGELELSKFTDAETNGFDHEDEGLESFGEHWSGFAEISGTEFRRDLRPNLFTIPEDKEIGVEEVDRVEKMYIWDKERDMRIPVGEPVVVKETKKGELSAPIATIDASDSEFDLDDLEELGYSSSETEKCSEETIRDRKDSEERVFASNKVDTVDGVTDNCESKDVALSVPDNTSRSVTFVKKVKITVTKEVKVEREHDLVENRIAVAKQHDESSNDIVLPDVNENITNEHETSSVKEDEETSRVHSCLGEITHPPYHAIKEVDETFSVMEPVNYKDEDCSALEIKSNTMEVVTKIESLPLKPALEETIRTYETSTVESAPPRIDIMEQFSRVPHVQRVETENIDVTQHSIRRPHVQIMETEKRIVPEEDLVQAKMVFDTKVDVHTDAMGSNIGLQICVTGRATDGKESKVSAENITREIPPVTEPSISAEQEKDQSQQPSTVKISVRGKDSGDGRESRKIRSPKGTPRSSPKPWESPRKTYLSSCKIRLTKSHEDLRFVGQASNGLKETSFIEEQPTSLEKVLEEDRQHNSEVPEDNIPTVQTESPLSSASPDVISGVRLDDAIESVEPDTVHTARITVQEVVGNTKRIVILNVRKKVHGTARWKSLNDLDTIAALHRRRSSDLWNGLTNFAEEGVTTAPKSEEKESGNQEKPQKPIRVEVRPREEAPSKYDSWNSKDTDFEKPGFLTATKLHPNDSLLADRSVSSISSIDGDKDFEGPEETLGASKVRVTDLDALIAQEANSQPDESLPSSDTQEVNETVHVWARIEPVLESVVRIEAEEVKAEEPVVVEPIILASAADTKNVAIEPVIVATAAETEEEASVIAAFPINDGYDDDELDDVFFEDYPPFGFPENTESMPTTTETHSSDADSETSSINSMPLKQRHRQTRAALEAAKAASNPGIRNHSDSNRSSDTATPVAELGQQYIPSTSSGSSTPDGKGHEISREESFSFKPLGQSSSTTRVIVKSAEFATTSIPVGVTQTTDLRRPRPRSELFNLKSDDDANKTPKGYSTSSRDVQTLPGLDVDERRFKEAADSRKSMPDLSKKGQTVNDSPYLRGLSAHTRKWLSQNVWTDPAGQQDEEDLMSSELFLYPSNKFQPGSNIDASFLSLANEGDFRDDISVSTLSTRPQSPMSEFSFAGETPYWGLQKGSTTVLKCSNPRCGREEVLFGSEKTSYTSCPACFTYYCTRACRRIHWSEHKKICFFGRINSYIRSFIYLCHKKETLKFQLSKIARDGLRKRGRGSVMVTFVSAQSARKFMTTGCTFFPSPPTYCPLVDLQSEGVISKHRVALTQNIKDYDPEEEFVLNLAIIAGKMENLPENPVPRRKVNTVLQVVKMPLSSKVKDSSPLSSPNDGNIETKVFYLPKCARHEFVNDDEARRHYCRNISKSLKQYGIRLKNDYPDIYGKLCLYVEQNIRFSEPLTVYGNQGKKIVICKIMPEAGDEIETGKK